MLEYTYQFLRDKFMKKIVLILDGMADRPQDVLDGKTPLEYAATPNLDKLHNRAKLGCVQTIGTNEEAGSAVANLSLLGYQPSRVYKGRAVIEAAGAGMKIDENDLYIRTNFITLSGENFDKSVIESYGAHDIETRKSKPLTKRLNDELFEDGYELINTGSFRNILIVKNRTDLYQRLKFMPPHDIINQPIIDYMTSDGSQYFFNLQKKAYKILSVKNETKANGIWFWGASIVPDLKRDDEDEKKIILSETILMRGIANLAEIECISVPESGDFEGFLRDKLTASQTALKSNDFIYIHIQKPDDLSHELMPAEKAEAIGQIDEIFVKGLIDGLEKSNETYCLVVASDHYTFSDTGGHGREPAPFMLIKSDDVKCTNKGGFSERACVNKGNVVSPRELLADR